MLEYRLQGRKENSDEEPQKEQKTTQLGRDGDRKVAEMEREEAKHRKRMAKLEAIRAKLSEKGNTEAAARVGQVLQKENDRYQRAMNRLQTHDEEASQEFRRKMQRLAERESARQKGVGEKGKRGDRTQGGEKDKATRESKDAEG